MNELLQINLFGDIFFYKFKITARALTDFCLPKYIGSTLRGGFGKVFKKISCPIKKFDCKDCFIAESCPYANVFSNPTKIKDLTFLNQNSNTPHPYILDLEFNKNKFKNYYKAGDNLEFSLIIVGEAKKYLPYIVYCFIELGKIGIGKDKGKYEILSIENDGLKIYDIGSKELKLENFEKFDFVKVLNNLSINNKKLYEEFFLDLKENELKRMGLNLDNYNYLAFNKNKDKKNISHINLNSNNNINKYNIRNSNKTDNPNNPKILLTISFLTPTRIKYNGKYINFIDFKILITNLIRRLFLLNILFCQTVDKNKSYNNMNSINFYSIFQDYFQEAENIKVDDINLFWYDWERYSSKQKTTMKLGGFIGRVSFCGYKDEFKKYIVPLVLGEQLHIGKGTAFGLGKYEIENVKL